MAQAGKFSLGKMRIKGENTRFRAGLWRGCSLLPGWMADGSPGLAQAPERDAVLARKVQPSRGAAAGQQVPGTAAGRLAAPHGRGRTEGLEGSGSALLCAEGKDMKEGKW